MRVLAALPHYPPRSRVGAWLATHEVLARLARRGHGVWVVTTLGRPGGYSLDGVSVHPRTSMSTFIQAADIVVTHLGGTGRHSQIAAACAARHVVMVHGENPLNQLLLQRLEPDLTVFNSHALASAVDHGGPTSVLHPAVRPEQFRTTPGDAITLVSLTEAKGAGTFYALAERNPDRKFLGVRGGYGEQVIRELPNIDIVDTVQDMREVYSRTRVLLAPSVVETYGMVGIEAMCSGIPVIAHPTPGLRESLGPAGIFADRDDTDAWLEALTTLDDPAAYEAASSRALDHVAALTPDADLDHLADLIEHLAEGATGG